jgi:ribonuclease P/MRP protein subunit RPP1
MALEARGLGFDGLVATGVPSGEYSGVTVREGVILAGMNAHETALQLKRHRGSGSVVFVQAGDNRFNRSVLGTTGVHVLCGIHTADRNAFDHVVAAMAAKNNVAVDISLAPLIQQRGSARQRALGRFFNILRLSRKFQFPVVLSTHAASVVDMRPVREISSLAQLIGFEPEEVERALNIMDLAVVNRDPVGEDVP